MPPTKMAGPSVSKSLALAFHGSRSSPDHNYDHDDHDHERVGSRDAYHGANHAGRNQCDDDIPGRREHADHDHEDHEGHDCREQ